jgi:hypothetical protein
MRVPKPRSRYTLLGTSGELVRNSENTILTDREYPYPATHEPTLAAAVCATVYEVRKKYVRYGLGVEGTKASNSLDTKGDNRRVGNSFKQARQRDQYDETSKSNQKAWTETSVGAIRNEEVGERHPFVCI